MTTPMPDYGLTFDKSNEEPNVIMLLKGEEYSENFIKDYISKDTTDYDLPKAQLWGIKKDSSYYLISQNSDVYDLLEEARIYDVSQCIGILVHTTGWAAPLNQDGEVEGAPSQHALRRRIALASCATYQSVGSAVYFLDTKETLTDPGSATGSLAEALVRLWSEIK